MIIPYDLDIFKRTDDVKMKNTMNNKSNICEKYDDSYNEEITKYCRMILDKETKKVFNTINIYFKINQVFKFQKISNNFNCFFRMSNSISIIII